jgi:hypothetical protein
MRISGGCWRRRAGAIWLIDWDLELGPGSSLFLFGSSPFEECSSYKTLKRKREQQ